MSSFFIFEQIRQKKNHNLIRLKLVRKCIVEVAIIAYLKEL